MALQVLSPMPGRVANLTEVPDPMFAEAMLGPGLAIDPPRSPVDGRRADLGHHRQPVPACHGHRG